MGYNLPISPTILHEVLIMLFGSKKRKEEHVQQINQKISEMRQYREKLYRQRQERVDSYVAQYRNDNDIDSMATTLWNGKSDPNCLKSYAETLVKELDSYDATGYKEESRFYLVITAMGVMWQNASADICVGENVKFLDWKISPVKDPEKRVAVITVFAEKIKDLLSETYKDSEIVVSFRNCEFYQVNSRMGNFKTLRIWELENDIAFIDQYKSAKVAGFPLPQKPPLFSGAEITIRPKVKKHLKEL